MKFLPLAIAGAIVSPAIVSALPTPPPPPVRMGILDQIWGSPEQWEGSASDLLSGSVIRVKGKDVNKPVAPKNGKSAPHVVYSDPLSVPIPMYTVQGKKWILGKSQLVPGGFGPLRVMFGGKEPTGRKVVELGVDNESEFKLIMVSQNQSTGTVVYMPFFRVCIRNPRTKKWKTCSPYGFASGILIPIKETQIMAIDINRPAFGNIKPPAGVKERMRNALSPSSLRRMGIQTAVSAGSSVVGSATGGGGSGAGPSTVTSTPYAGQFNGQTMSPVNAEINSPYGIRVHPIKGKLRHHDGVDFPVNIGTPVMAVASGRIMFQGTLDGFGNTVVVDHGSGYMSLYAHLAPGFIAQTGATVPMGAVIALSGSSGDSTGPHLHLGVIAGGDGQSIHSGHYINPESFIRSLR